MTIASHVRELNDRLTRIERCADMAPEGTYERAKQAAAAINDASNGILDALRSYDFKALNDDRLRNLEAAIYGYLLEGNPDESSLITGEGFGEHIDGPAGARVMAQAIQDRDAIAGIRESAALADLAEGLADILSAPDVTDVVGRARRET